MPAPIIAPSILSADPLNFEKELLEIEAGGADWHHIDVMDGHFVPNLTFGYSLISAIKKVSKIPLDVHIMVSNPDDTALKYVEAGADLLSFHLEAARHPHRLIQSIKSAGARAGISINPGSSLELVKPLLYDADLLLIMSVNPGFGGQSFIPQSVSRIQEASDFAKSIGRTDLIIQVDGGITDKTVTSCKKAGANAFVAGSYIYQSENRSERITSLKQI